MKVNLSSRPSLNMKALFSDRESVHEDSWMISYIDVFVLMTTIFVMLLALSKAESGLAVDGVESPAKLMVEEIEFISEQDLKGQPLDVSVIKNQLNQTWLKDVASSIELHGLEDHIQLQDDASFTELQIQSKVLFDSGDSELSRSGISVLEKLLPVLIESEGVIFIEGHTDDRPIQTVKFRSNWDLASARANEVLQFFVAEGMASERLRAVSYGDTKPLVVNDSGKNRQKNRRVSLMVQRQVR